VLDRAVSTLLMVLTLSQAACRTKSADLGGVYYCSFQAVEDARWVGVSAEPCSAGVPRQNYIRPTDFGIGGGFTLIADRCEDPLVLYLGPSDYDIASYDGSFDARELTLAQMLDLEPRPECQTAVVQDGVFDRMAARNPLWEEVRVIK
jgi:hypothetical protein